MSLRLFCLSAHLAFHSALPGAPIAVSDEAASAGHRHGTGLCSPPPAEAAGNWHRRAPLVAPTLPGWALGPNDINLQNPLIFPWAPAVLFGQSASLSALYSFSILHM